MVVSKKCSTFAPSNNKNIYNNEKENYFSGIVGGSIARSDWACMLLVAPTRVRRLVAGGSDFVLRCFVGWVDDCGGGYDRKEVKS